MHVDGDINVLPMQNKGAVVNNAQQRSQVQNSPQANKPIQYGTQTSSNIKGDGTPIGQHTNAKNVVNHTPTNSSNNAKVAQNGSQRQLKGTPTNTQGTAKASDNQKDLAQTNAKTTTNNSAVGLIAGITLTGFGLLATKKEQA